MAGEDRYRLAAVRDVRARDEQARKGDLAVAVGEAQEAESRLAAARSRTETARTALAAARTIRDDLLARGASSADLVRAEAYFARRMHDVRMATAEELRLEATHAGTLDEVAAAQRTLARARAERQVIERHFERWREHKKRLAERRDD